MGKALVLFDADYTLVGHGKVTYTGSSELQSIVISGPDSVVGMTKQYLAIYFPPTTSQTGVTWSISSGGQYATISSGGLLTIDSSALNNQVVITATSTVNTSIVGVKTVTVTYSEVEDSLWSVALADPDFRSYMTGMTKSYELSTPLSKDGTEAGELITSPVTSSSQNYVLLFDATFPAQINTDNPLLFARLGIGATLASLGVDYWYFLPNFGNSNRTNIGIPKGQNYRAKILLHMNMSTGAVFVKNLTNSQTYSFNTTPSGSTVYGEFRLGGAGSSENYYNGIINQFIIGVA